MLWLLGEVERNSSLPFAEQLCQVSYGGADVAAIHWTQRADGLMCADAGGHVSMYETLMTGADHMPGVIARQTYSVTGSATLISLQIESLCTQAWNILQLMAQFSSQSVSRSTC